MRTQSITWSSPIGLMSIIPGQCRYRSLGFVDWYCLVVGEHQRGYRSCPSPGHNSCLPLHRYGVSLGAAFAAMLQAPATTEPDHHLFHLHLVGVPRHLSPPSHT